MTSDDIRKLVHDSYAAYDRGDGQFIANLFDDDIDWTLCCPPEALPMPNHVHGKAAVLDALKKIHDAVEVIHNRLELVMVDGDRAATICDQKARQRSTGRILRYKMAAFHRYRNGKLIEYLAFADGFDVMQQALGRTIDVPPAYPD